MNILNRNDFLDSNRMVCKEEKNEFGAVDYTVSIDNVNIGFAEVTYCDKEEIENLYYDSVDDFDGSCLNFFNKFDDIANIEDFWLENEYKGRGLSKHVLNIIIENILKRCSQIILRSTPCGKGLDENALVSLYEKCGFTTLQETDNDGVIMGYKK